MQVGLKEFINQIGKNLHYSEVLYEPSKVTGGLNKSFADWNDRGAIWVIIQSIVLSVPTVGAAVATIFDQHKRVILQFNMDSNMSGQIVLDYPIESSRLDLECSRTDVLFTVGYQYLSVVDSPQKK